MFQLISPLVEGLRSRCEILFEYYCESNSNIDWVYKNGDVGLNYFSIVYRDALGKHKLFYPDYIVKMNDGRIFVIETKGGETRLGDSKNIDKDIANKFESLKDYAKRECINWAFVRDKNNKLYFNNSDYSESLEDRVHWIKITDLF